MSDPMNSYLGVARLLYPDFDEEAVFGPGDYTPILTALGEVLIRVDEEDYQGDTWAVVRRNGLLGYVEFGWGSCSGCDALQACESYEDIAKLILRIWSITWRTPTEFRAWFEAKDWKGDYSWQDDQFQLFLSQVRTLLEGES